jgi:type VI secretion system protein VasI
MMTYVAHRNSQRIGNRPRALLQIALGLVALAFATAAPGTAGAQESDHDALLSELRAIHQLEDPVERLQAFDTLAEELFGEAARSEDPDPTAEAPLDSEGEADTGSWLVIVDSDPITDEKVFLALLDAESGRNEFGTAPTLILRRTGEHDEVYISWSDYFADDYVRVTHRIDQAEPETRSWAVSTDDDATFFPGDATALMRDLADAERLVVRTTPYNASPITAVFALEGLEEGLLQNQEVVGDLVGEAQPAGDPES